jgi:hypothetical protein
MIFCSSLAVIIRVAQSSCRRVEGGAGVTEVHRGCRWGSFGGRHMWEDLDMCEASVKMDERSRLD